jgi:FMN phosphatase YigB (HAD superfamily)
VSLRWAIRILVTLAAVAVLVGCQLDAVVDLDVDQDGSGTVVVTGQLDAEANAQLGGLATQLRVTDLERSGWDITQTDTEAGGVEVVAVKAVANRNDWQPTLDEIAGPGVFTNVRIETDDAFANTSQQLSFEVDLSQGWDLAASPEFTEALGGEPFGAPIASLTNGRSLDEIVSVDVVATVVDDPDGTPASGTYTARFDGDPVQVRLASTTEHSTAILLRWIAMALFALFGLATVLAITGIVVQRKTASRRPATTPSTLASRVPGSDRTTAQPSVTRSRSTATRLVVIDPLAVLYGYASPFADEVLPFVRSQGSDVRADVLQDAYDDLITGAIDTDDFWDRSELAGHDFDALLVEQRQLRSGAGRFMNDLEEAGLRLAAVTNDAEAWSGRVRHRDRLTGMVPWLVSSKVGSPKSSLGIFEVTRRESGVAYRQCLCVDSSIETLDAARELGMRTVLFDSGAIALPEIVGHRIVTDLRDVLDD